MDQITVPEDLTEVDDAALTEMGEAIAARAGELAEGDLDDDAITEIETLAEAADRVDTESNTRAEAAADRAARAEAALARFRPAVEDVPVEGAPEAVEPEVEPAVAAAAAVEPEVEPAVAAAVEPAVEAPKHVGSLTLLKAKAPAVAAPVPAAETHARLAATAHAPGVTEGREFGSTLDIAAAIARKRQSMSNVPSGVREFVSIASGEKGGLAHVLGADAIENFEVLQQVREENNAVVASGGNCAPISPLYDFYRLAVPQNPVESALSVVQAPRGGIRYIVPPSYTAGAAGIAITTEAQDAAGYVINGGSTPNKPFVTVSCPGINEVQVEAISQSVRWGNLQYRTFPEQVAAFMEDMAVLFASRKEVVHIDYIDANSTPVTSVSPYGATRGILFDLQRAAVAYRKRNAMLRGSNLTVMLPDWAIDLVKADMANDGTEGLNFLSITDAQVEAFLRNRGLSPVWMNDAKTSDAKGQKFNSAQAAGALHAWPTAVVAYLFSPGTFVRLDGGTLDVGLVRDSVLNRSNDLELFFEEWLATAMLGIESIKLTMTVCPSGTGAALTTPFSC